MDGLSELTAITDLPVVQDQEDGALVWERWGAYWRDVFVVGRDNRAYTVFNLDDHDLKDEDNFTMLADFFIAAGEEP